MRSRSCILKLAPLTFAAVVLLGRNALSADKVGLSPENAKTSLVILGNGQGHPATIQLHTSVLKALPHDVKALVLNSRYGNGPDFQKFKENFKADLDSGRLTILEMEDAIEWVRDYTPELVFDPSGQPKLVRFNYVHGQLGARAEKMADQSAEAIQKSLSGARPLAVLHSTLAMEGGSYFVDENAKLFISSKVLEANRNRTSQEIEKELEQALDVKEILWLPPLPGELTGHLDIYAKYLGGNKILLASSHLPNRMKVLEQAENVFVKNGYQVLRSPFVELEGMPESRVFTYVNSLIVDGTVFVPQYAEAKLKHSADYSALLEGDRKALDIYREAGFKKIVKVPTLELISLGGAVHCMTKQFSEF